jgi:ferredoxin
VTDPLKISLERDKCLAAGMCAFHAPATFDISDEDMKVVLLDERDSDEALRAAADACPNRVITITQSGKDAS